MNWNFRQNSTKQLFLLTLHINTVFFFLVFFYPPNQENGATFYKPGKPRHLLRQPRYVALPCMTVEFSNDLLALRGRFRNLFHRVAVIYLYTGSRHPHRRHPTPTPRHTNKNDRDKNTPTMFRQNTDRLQDRAKAEVAAAASAAAIVTAVTAG